MWGCMCSAGPICMVYCNPTLPYILLSIRRTKEEEEGVRMGVKVCIHVRGCGGMCVCEGVRIKSIQVTNFSFKNFNSSIYISSFVLSIHNFHINDDASRASLQRR